MVFFMVWLKQDYAGLRAYTEQLVAAGHPLAEDFEELVAMGGAGASPLEFLSGLKPEQYAAKQWDLVAALKTLASQDPKAALEFFEAMPEGDLRLRENAIKNLAIGWRKNDPAGALKWARSFEAVGDRIAALDQVICGMVLKDVHAAAAAFGESEELVRLGATGKTSQAMQLF